MATATQRLIAILKAAGVLPGPLQHEIDTLDGLVAAEQKELDQARVDIAALQTRLGAAEASVNSLQADLLAVKTSIAGFATTTDVNAVVARVTAIEDELDADLQDEEKEFPIVIEPATLPAATVGTPYSQQLTATEGRPPYTFAATGLPADLTLSSDGLLSGTPSAAETASIVVTATDADGETGTITYDYTAA